jgi:hypothetical protein
MAKFDYTRAAWDKVKPKLLPKTGLGKALDAYTGTLQAVHSAKLHKNKSNAQFKKDLALVVSTFNDVEARRLAAIKSCGKIFPDTKKFLESADPKKQRAAFGSSACVAMRPLVPDWNDELDSEINKMTGFVKTAKSALDLMQKPTNRKNQTLVDKLKKTYLNEGDQKSNSAKDMLGEFGTFVLSNKSFRDNFSDIEADLGRLEVKLATLTKLYLAYRKITDELKDILEE